MGPSVWAGLKARPLSPPPTYTEAKSQCCALQQSSAAPQQKIIRSEALSSSQY
jgi:hypothetical protein